MLARRLQQFRRVDWPKVGAQYLHDGFVETRATKWRVSVCGADDMGHIFYTGSICKTLC